MINQPSFPCNACGQCCRHVHLSELTTYLDRGDGACRHFDETTNLCRIYAERPLVCRVEAYYQAHLKEHYDWQTFVDMNVQICKVLQESQPHQGAYSKD